MESKLIAVDSDGCLDLSGFDVSPGQKFEVFTHENGSIILSPVVVEGDAEAQEI